MTIRFHRKIYPAGAVTAARKAFAEFGTVASHRDGDYTVVEIEVARAEYREEVVGEFRNYVLGETIARRWAS